MKTLKKIDVNQNDILQKRQMKHILGRVNICCGPGNNSCSGGQYTASSCDYGASVCSGNYNCW